MLLRRVARPMFASWFLVEGLDAVRHPSSHAVSARDGITALQARLTRYAHLTGAERLLDDRYGVDVDAVLGRTLGRELSDRQLVTAVRVHGAAMLVAAAMLAVGRAPRTSALALAALAAPVALVNAPAGRGVTVATLDQPSAQAVRRRRFWAAVSATGGALLASADYEGRPGLGWRWQNAWETRAAVKDAVREATADD